MAIPGTSSQPLPARPLHGAARSLRAVRIIHPFPTLLNAAASVTLAMVAVDGWPGTGVVARLALTMFFAQSAIGIVNDCVDHRLDAAAKPWKPVPSGAISLRWAWRLGALAVLLALLAGATLGPAAWALSTAGMCVGLSYDLWFKRTALSGLTYAVALPLVPLWVWTAVDLFTPSLLWVWPVGLLLGGALQLANALPDLDDDDAGGVRGTAQLLGRRGALAAAWGGYLTAIALALGLGLALGHDARMLGLGVGAALALLALAIGAYVRDPSSRSLQLGWSVLAPGAGVLALGWLASMP